MAWCHCLKNPLCSACSSLPPPANGNNCLLFKKKLIDFIFQSSFRFTDKLSRKCGVPIYRLTLPPPQFPPLLTSCIITIDEPILIHYYSLKSTVYIRVHSFFMCSVGFDKCIMTFIHYTVSYRIVSLS